MDKELLVPLRGIMFCVWSALMVVLGMWIGGL